MSNGALVLLFLAVVGGSLAYLPMLKRTRPGAAGRMACGALGVVAWGLLTVALSSLFIAFAFVDLMCFTACSNQPLNPLLHYAPYGAGVGASLLALRLALRHPGAEKRAGAQ